MKTLTKRPRYIPAGFVKYERGTIDNLCETYVPQNGDPVAIFYIGKQSKASWYYRFEDKVRMETKIATSLESVRKYEELKAESKEARKAPTTFKIGDILYTSWGYDQTNINFYKVIGLKGKQTVELREIGSKIVSGTGGPTTHVVADPDRFISDKVLLKRAINNHVKINSYASATLWDGKPKYETGAGWGH